MNTFYKNSLKIITKILELTTNIDSIVKSETFNNTEDLIKEKDLLLIEFNSIDKKDFSKNEKEKINLIISKIKQLETIYIKKIKSLIEDSKKEKKDIVINKKLSNAYKISVENKPKMIDEKE